MSFLAAAVIIVVFKIKVSFQLAGSSEPLVFGSEINCNLKKATPKVTVRV